MKINIEKKDSIFYHKGSVYTLETEQRNTFIFPGSSDRVIAAWDIETMVPLDFYRTTPAIIYALCFCSRKEHIIW